MRKLSHAAYFLMIMIILSSLVAGCVGVDRSQQLAQSGSAQQQGEAKYIFLFIGDGMSTNQRLVTELYLGGPADDAMIIPRLKMNSLPVVGLTRTHNWNTHVTDSASSATAMATGRKTLTNHVSVDPIDKKPMKTIAQIVQERGWRVGLVSSSPIDDGTPAAFYAHEDSRSNRYEISLAAANSGIYYLAGAPVGARMAEDDPREAPLERAVSNGYRLVKSRDELLALKPNSGPVWAFNMPGKVALGMSYDIDRGPREPSLAEFTRKGIELLDNPNGFFMMVEGGLTDWSGHGNCLASTIREVLALDEAVKEALLFYALHPDETLIIVTGDHETGGLSMGSVSSNHDLLRERVDGQKVSMATLLRAIARWRQDETSFEDALPEIQDMMGWPELTEDEIGDLRAAYPEGMKGQPYRERDREVQRRYGMINPLQAAISQKISSDSGVTWTTGGHSGEPVMTTAIGVGSQLFGGYHDNTDIFRYMLAAAGIPIPPAPAVTPAPAKVAAPDNSAADEPAQVLPVPVTAAQ